VSGTSQDVTRVGPMCHEGLMYVQYSLGFFGLCSVCWVWGCCCVGLGFIPPSSCHTWTTSALFCDAGIRRGLFVRRCRFVPPLLLLPQEFVMGSLLGMADRPRSRGFRPAPCNWGTTECCVARRCHGIICGRVDVPVGYLVL